MRKIEDWPQEMQEEIEINFKCPPGEVAGAISALKQASISMEKINHDTQSADGVIFPSKGLEVTDQGREMMSQFADRLLSELKRQNMGWKDV